MLYMSRGLPVGQFHGSITVNLRGRNIELDREQTRMWLAGCRGPRLLDPADLDLLAMDGLIVTSLRSNFEKAVYQILSACMLCPSEKPLPFSGLSMPESDMLRWIHSAGLMLTIAELTKLAELQQRPEARFLGSANRQQLIDLIYSSHNATVGSLDGQMEFSLALPITVRTLLSLLQKRRIVLI